MFLVTGKVEAEQLQLPNRYLIHQRSFHTLLFSGPPQILVTSNAGLGSQQEPLRLCPRLWGTLPKEFGYQVTSCPRAGPKAQAPSRLEGLKAV